MLSSPSALSRPVIHPVHLHLEGARPEADQPEINQRVAYPALYPPSLHPPALYHHPPALDVGLHLAAAYPAAPAAVERLLCVKQAVSRFRRSRDTPSNFSRSNISPRVGRRRLRRRLVQAVARIERSPEYQRSLAELAQLAASFQAELEPAQRSQWLELEDALLEHVAWLNRSYFHAGAAWGERYGKSQRQPARVVEGDARRRARVDVQVMVALARAVMKLTQR